jgi:hypothetical protein
MKAYITEKGVTRDCWQRCVLCKGSAAFVSLSPFSYCNTHRLATYMSGLFGEPDPLPTASLSSGMKGEGKLRPRLLPFVREPCLYCTRGLPV